MTKLNFVSSVSHDPSEIFLLCWFATQEMFLLLLLMLKTVVLPNIFMETVFSLNMLNMLWKHEW